MTESDDDLLDVEAVDELDLDDVDSVEALSTDDLPDASELDLTQLGPLVGLAKSVLESVTAGDDDPSAGKLQALLHLVNLIQGVLTTTDTDELLDTLDLDELDSVVDLDSLPEALESGDVGDAVELKNLRKLIEFGQLWDAVDLTELMGSKDEISDTVGELTGDDDGEGGLFDGLEMEDLTGGDDEGEMGSLTDPEMIQAATQAQLDSAIDGFRELLVETHARLDELREANQARFDGVDQPSSRNPTAFSTLTTHRGAPKDASRASTVPRNVRHSTGPSRRRIYGRRFTRLMEEKQADEKAAGESVEEETVDEQTAADEPTADDGGEDR
ncbi:hypothetical protein [Halohasta litorea]|uniref:Uncharacterized protein n=1 Tax=Halohasta litorea TaxID=869891 RepID=A0ABD6D512_9EURY|nr:hypothetical protein [Halohasta litorea]